MLYRIIFAALATALLGATAYAVVPGKADTAQLVPLNITIIQKNQAWPLKGNITLDPCSKVMCRSA